MLSYTFGLLASQLACVLFASTIAAQSTTPDWTNGPFTVHNTSILGADGTKFTYAGVNWPGASEVMIPEGLQYQSIKTIVDRIKSLGMNSVRLTYATEMIDQVFDNGMSDVLITKALTDALGSENGTKVFEQVIAKNPQFNSTTKRFDVFDEVVAECNRQQIYVHIDNHVSKASWCCDLTDGNAWWGDTYFNQTKWSRGLVYMANRASRWPNIISMSLYNELRPALGKDAAPYNWEYWYGQVKDASRAIFNANPKLLIFLSGLLGDMDLQAVVEGTALDPGTGTFNKSEFAPFEDKLVLELHSYDIVFPVENCPSYNEKLITAGYSAVTGGVPNRFPVVLSEWGFPQDNETWRSGTYARCAQDFLRDIVPGQGWFIWAIAGGYYIRQGTQDYNETWGLLTHDWSAWRSPDFIERGLKPLVTTSLAAAQGNTSSATPAAATTPSAPTSGSRVQSPTISRNSMLFLATWGFWLVHDSRLF